MIVSVKRKACKEAKASATARVAASPGVTDMGASQVTLIVSAEDVYGLPSVIAVLALSTTEARKLALAMVESADKANERAQEQARMGTLESEVRG